MKRAALCALVLSTAASATEHTFGDGQWAFEGRGFYKTFGAGLRVPQGLVDETAALASLLAEAGAPASAALPREGALSTHVVRLSGRLRRSEWLELSAAWQVGASVASHSAFTRGTGLGSAVPVGGAATAQRRLVDFDPVLLTSGSAQAVHNLDLLSLKLKLPKGELVAGRQVLSWGTGRFWNPTDLLSPFGPTDIDKEVRRGVDAVRYSFPLSEVTLVDVLWLPQRRAADQGGVVRVQTNVKSFDVSASAAKYAQDLVFGVDFSGDVGPLAVHGEAAYTLGLTGLGEAGPAQEGERFLRAVAGVDRRVGDVLLMAEYYYNGFGASSAAGYAQKMQSDRVVRGEVFGAGRHYLGVGASWKASDLFSVSGTAIVNLVDPSVMVVPALEYWIEQSVIVRAGAYLPIGRAPDPGPIQRLTPADLWTQSDAYRAATDSLGLRSEYGASPLGVFAQAGLYF